MDSTASLNEETGPMKGLGEYLKSERRSQQLSLEALTQRTRISPRMLEAIETGDFEEIGAPVLIRGFLRAYCREVGLDAETILEEYDRKICECDPSKASYQNFQRLHKPFRKKSRMGIYFLALLALGVAGFFWAQDWIAERKERLTSAPESMRTDTYPQQEQELLSDVSDVGRQEREEASPEPSSALPENAPPETEDSARNVEDVPSPEAGSDEQQGSAVAPPASDDGAPLPSERPEESAEAAAESAAQEPAPSEEVSGPDRTAPPPPSSRQHRLYVEADQETWIQVSIDGGKKVQGVLLKPGETRQWEGDDNMEIVVGNAGGIRLKWDDKSLKPLGKSGQVVHLNLPDPQYMQ